ncbi:hypothetical protein ALQ82_200226 [Pseudomonas syringae pv. pisi]|nr:hypothetical protein ALQ82_200226 [Pseudomonas syringae pv. pisi]
MIALQDEDFAHRLIVQCRNHDAATGRLSRTIYDHQAVMKNLRTFHAVAIDLGHVDVRRIELSDTKRRSVGLGSAADEVVAIRRLWEQMANRALENAGSDARIDSRSLKAQGLDREATMHLGPVASDMERRGKASDRGDGNRKVAVNNAMLEQI